MQTELESRRQLKQLLMPSCYGAGDAKIGHSFDAHMSDV